jgi:hypothetical protein
MKKLFSWTLAAAFLAGVAGLVAVNRQQAGSIENGNTANADSGSAAFRDGAYLGTLAGQRGEASHIAKGRWVRQNDRDAFAAGYEQAYAKNAPDAGVAQADKATKAAFRDGLYLGKFDASTGKEQHIAAGRWARSDDRLSFAAGYLQAYQETLVAMR